MVENFDKNKILRKATYGQFRSIGMDSEDSEHIVVIKLKRDKPIKEFIMNLMNDEYKDKPILLRITVIGDKRIKRNIKDETPEEDSKCQSILSV